MPDDKIPLIKIPRNENTIEKPDTKNTEFSITFDLLIETMFLFPTNSLIVLPDMYAIKAGTIGNMHGATKDASPAITAIAIVTSDIHRFTSFDLLELVHIRPQSL